MSWPSTDSELEIENELRALRKVAAEARRVVAGRIPAVSAEREGSTWKHSRISDGLTDALAKALADVPEPST